MDFKLGVAKIIADGWKFTDVIYTQVVNTLKRQGKICIADIRVISPPFTTDDYHKILQVPSSFIPKETTSFYVQCIKRGYIDGKIINSIPVSLTGRIDTDGVITIKNILSSGDLGYSEAISEVYYIHNVAWEVK